MTRFQNIESLKWLLGTLKSLISMEFFSFFLRKFSQLHALLELPRLSISENPATNAVFYVINIFKKSQ